MIENAGKIKPAGWRSGRQSEENLLFWGYSYGKF
jgi:hypothetical protein